MASVSFDRQSERRSLFAAGDNNYETHLQAQSAYKYTLKHVPGLDLKKLSKRQTSFTNMHSKNPDATRTKRLQPGLAPFYDNSKQSRTTRLGIKFDNQLSRDSAITESQTAATPYELGPNYDSAIKAKFNSQRKAASTSSFEKLTGRDNSVYRISEGFNLDGGPKTWFDSHSAVMRTLVD